MLWGAGRARLKAECCRLPNRCLLSKTEHGLKYRASIHSTAAIQNGRGGAFSRTKEEEEDISLMRRNFGGGV